jgi:predicted CXXCH cytochrome family protein
MPALSTWRKRLSAALVRAGRTACVLWGAVLLALAPAALAAEAPETIDPGASCVSGECHAEMEDFSQLHWTDFNATGECQKCHEPDGDAHDFETGEAPDACLECHEELAARARGAETEHESFPDCLDCHDAHGGEVKGLLLEIEDEDLKPLCFECHEEDEVFVEEVVHGPVERGACTMCHDPHVSENRKLLRGKDGPELCGECHEELMEELEAAKYLHDPVEDSCTDCHHPHTGPYEKLLIAEKRLLCDECHDDIVELAEDSSVDHEPTQTKEECLNCHAPHASNHQPNLRKPQRELCLGCHDERVKSGDTELANLGALLSRHDVWHEPIREDKCADCHQPHGSEHRRLLAGAFPTTLYASFDVEAYALCFSCHKRALVTRRSTRDSTGFRDGDRNLHYLHVNKAKRGRTCRVCHELHAGRQERLIRQKVRYGAWLMPMNFEPSEEGGSCLPGCHKLRTYDRKAKSRRTGG